jgi:hypothetical protein
MDRFNADPIRTKVITGVGRQTEKSTANSEHVWSPDNNELVFTGLTRYSLKQKVKFRGCYMRERSEIKNLSESQKLADTFGVNAREFIPAAWELMPWSFLIDYFSNIGDILEQTFVSLENMRWINKTVVDESLTEIHSNLNHARTAAAIFFAGWSQIVSSSPGADARVSVNRVGFSRGAGGLYVSPFVLEIPGSLQKWLNITALGIQANSIHPQRFMRFARG